MAVFVKKRGYSRLIMGLVFLTLFICIVMHLWVAPQRGTKIGAYLNVYDIFQTKFEAEGSLHVPEKNYKVFYWTFSNQELVILAIIALVFVLGVIRARLRCKNQFRGQPLHVSQVDWFTSGNGKKNAHCQISTPKHVNGKLFFMLFDPEKEKYINVFAEVGFVEHVRDEKLKMGDYYAQKVGNSGVQIRTFTNVLSLQK